MLTFGLGILLLHLLLLSSSLTAIGRCESGTPRDGRDGHVHVLEVVLDGLDEAIHLGCGSGTDVVGQLLSSLLGESHSLGTVGLEGRSVCRGSISSLRLTSNGGGVNLATNLVSLLAVVVLLDNTVLGPGFIDGIDALNLGLAEPLLHETDPLDAPLQRTGFGLLVDRSHRVWAGTGLVEVLHVALVLAGLLLGCGLGTLLLKLGGRDLHFLLGLLGPALGHGFDRLLAGLHHALLKLELRLRSSLVVVDWSRGRLVWLHHRLRVLDRCWLEDWWERRSRGLHRRRRHRGAPRASLAHLGTVVEVVTLVVGALNTLALLRVANVLLWGSHRSRSRGRLRKAVDLVGVLGTRWGVGGWSRDGRGSRRHIHDLLVSLGHGECLGGR